jgi:hypothetical protein
MRILQILACVFTILLLSNVCSAEKTWDSAPDNLSLKAGDDFQKTKSDEKGASLELFSKKKNAQLILTQSGIPPTKGESKVPVVTTSDFIKAFPALSAEKNLKVHAGPVKLTAGGTPVALYEIESANAFGYQTVYAYVGRGKKPYALILNYPSPRNPEMVKLMKQFLGSIKHK